MLIDETAQSTLHTHNYPVFIRTTVHICMYLSLKIFGYNVWQKIHAFSHLEHNLKTAKDCRKSVQKRQVQ